MEKREEKPAEDSRKVYSFTAKRPIENQDQVFGLSAEAQPFAARCGLSWAEWTSSTDLPIGKILTSRIEPGKGDGKSILNPKAEFTTKRKAQTSLHSAGKP